MDETTLMRELLERTTESEPPIGPMPQNALRQGIGLRRRRRARFAAATAAALAVICVAALAATGAGGSRSAAPVGGPAVAYVLGGSRTAGTVTPISGPTGLPESPIVVEHGRPYMGANLQGDSQIAASPDGKTVWVSDGPAVTPISTATNAAENPITLVHQPSQGIQQVLIAPDGKTIYALDTTVAVTPISTATHRAGKPIGLGTGTGGPAEMAITPNGKTLYVLFLYPPGTATSYVIPISTVTDRPGTPIRVPADVSAIVAAPDGRTVYLVGQPRPKGSANPSTTIEVTPVATATNRPGKPIIVGNGDLGISIPVVTTPDGRTMYILVNATAGHPSGVTPFSLVTGTPGGLISLGSAELLDIAMAPGGRTAYVLSVPAGGFHPGLDPACGNSPGDVTPIATATNTATAPISVNVGCEPEVVTVTPNGKTVYVVSMSGVTPVTTASGRAGKRINVEMPQAIVTVPR